MTLATSALEGEAPASPSPALPATGDVEVQMRAFIAGTRNGQDWPPVGGTVVLPAHEAADLIRAGLAQLPAATEEPVAAEEPAATAKTKRAAKQVAPSDED